MSMNKLQRIENKPVLTSIFIMSLPVILGNIAQIVYNLTDVYFIGQLQDVAQLAGATYAFPLMMILSSIGAIFGMGGASYLSRCLGRGRQDLAENTLTKSLFYSLITGVVIVIFSLVFLDDIIRILGSDGEAYNYTRQYVFIIVLFSPIIMINSASIYLIRAEGAAKLASIAMIIGVGTNLILDPIFIFTLGLEVKGAAIATVIGNSCSFIFNLFCYKYLTHIKVRMKTVFERNKVLTEIVKVGIPGALNIILMSFSIILTNNIAGSYGDDVVAGIGLAQRNLTIIIQILLGFSMGTQPLIGYNYGKRDYKKVKKLIYTNMRLISLIGTIMGIIFYILAEPLISVFNKDPSVVYNGARGLRAMLLMKPLISVFMVSMGSVQAMGKALIALIFSVTRQLFLFMAAILILNHYFGYDGFIYAQAVSDGIMIIFSGIVITFILRNMVKGGIDSDTSAENINFADYSL